VFAQSAAFSTDERVATVFQDALSARWQYRDTTFPEAGAMPVPVGPTVPLVLFLLARELDANAPLLARAGIDQGAGERALDRSEAAFHWRDDERGVPTLVVVARDDKALLAAATALVARPTLPTPGWAAL
jgi:hypothetical protein